MSQPISYYKKSKYEYKKTTRLLKKKIFQVTPTDRRVTVERERVRLFATKILCERARARTFLLQKRNHNVRDTLTNQPVQLDDDDDEFVDAQATKAISST